MNGPNKIFKFTFTLDMTGITTPSDEEFDEDSDVDDDNYIDEG